MRVVCIDDQNIVRYGFLWLKKRQEKDVRLTAGKEYRVVGIDHTVYRTVPRMEFIYYLIQDDRGILQLFEQERFKVANGK